MAGPVNKGYLIGHEYDLGNGSMGVWGGGANGFMDPPAYMALKQKRGAELADNQKTLQRLDEAVPMTKPWDATGFLGGLESGEGQPGWSPVRGIGGTAGYDLNKKLLPVRSNATIQNMLKLKNASQTGSTGFGNLSEAEGEKLASTDAVLDTRQSQGALQKEIGASREALIRHTPGIHPSNPIDLETMSANDVPDGAFFKGPDGRVYQQKHGAGWPKAGAAGPAPDPRAAANTALRAKSGRPVLLGVEPGGD